MSPLAQMLRDYRHFRRLGVRELAKTIGVSSSALCRLENDKPVTVGNMFKLLVWLTGDAP